MATARTSVNSKPGNRFSRRRRRSLTPDRSWYQTSQYRSVFPQQTNRKFLLYLIPLKWTLNATRTRKSYLLRVIFRQLICGALGTHPDSGFGQVGPHGDLLPGAHVGVPVPREGRLQLLQLLAGEVRPLPSLPLRLLVVLAVVAVARFHAGHHLGLHRVREGPACCNRQHRKRKCRSRNDILESSKSD